MGKLCGAERVQCGGLDIETTCDLQLVLEYAIVIILKNYIII